MQQEPTSMQDAAKDHLGYDGEPEKTKILVNDVSKNGAENEQDLHVLNQKLRIQNEKLRSQLKELSYKLTETLEKVKNKKNPEKTAVEFREDTLRKELENSTKQLQSYQKENEKLKYKLETTHTQERVTKLENLLREKDRVIEEMTVEKRNLEKIKRDQEKQLDIIKNERDYITKMNMYAEEVKGLKDKIREMQKYEKHEEKSFKKQQEYLVILEAKYREVCEKAGVSASLNFTTAQDMNERHQKFKSLKVRDSSAGAKDIKKVGGTYSTKNGKSAVDEDAKSDTDEKIELTETKFKEMKNIIQILKKAKTTTDRRYKSEIDQLNSKIKELEFDLGRAKTEARDKDKELNIITFKYNELKRMSKHNQLNPIEQPATQKPADKALEKIKSAGQLGQKIPIKSNLALGRKEKKGRVNVKLPEFDDFSLGGKEAKISKLTVWFDKEQIYGLRAVYTLPDGSDVSGKEHLLVEHRDHLECQALEIETDDRIAAVSGKYNNFIGYLKIATAKGKIHEFGYENGNNAAQSFLFDIETNENPSVLFGALDKANDNDSALAYLGFQITKIESKDEIKDETKH